MALDDTLHHLGRLPKPLMGLARRLGFMLMYYFPGYRRSLVDKNLRLALPTLSAQQHEKIARDYYQHLSSLAVEILRTPTMTAKDLEHAVTFINPEVVTQSSNNFTRSVVFISIHQGNWEWMLHGISRHFGITVNPIYKPLHNAAADRFLHAVRSRFGSTPIAAQDTAAHLLRNRRNTQAIAILADQAPVAGQPAITTQFMGQATAFHSGFTQLLRLTDAVLIFAACHRVGEHQYAIEFHPMAQAQSSKQTQTEYVQWYAALAEQSIRNQPHTWLWSHNRWRRGGN